jgi:hypothetical protein
LTSCHVQASIEGSQVRVASSSGFGLDMCYYLHYSSLQQNRTMTDELDREVLWLAFTRCSRSISRTKTIAIANPVYT